MNETVAILTLMAGIGVFLIACTMLSSNLESVCSVRLRNLFARASDKKLVGVGIGTAATAAIQSSGATTVLVIGFVNAGIMSLTLAAAVIYGANIGTTITAQIVALGLMGGGTLSVTVIFSAFAGIGAFMAAYAKKDKNRKIGYIIAAFGLLFVGLSMMSDAMEGFAEMDSVKNFLASIHNLILLVIIGAILTAIVQSSSVVTSIVITMLFAGLIDLQQGIYLTMGSNIGSCIVAIMAGFSSGINAKRTALIHLLFNVTGVTIFVIAGYIMGFASGGSLTYASLFAAAFPVAETQLAMFHTIFNVITVIIMLPLTSRLIKVVTRIIPDKEVPPEKAEAPRMFYVDDHMLKTPAIAVGEVKNEIINMGRIAMSNFNRSCKMILEGDLSEKEDFVRVEKQLNFTNKQLTRFLAKLTKCELSSKDVAYVSTAFRSINDMERIGDYAENIVGYAEKLSNSGGSFSTDAHADIEEACKRINELFEKSIEAYTECNRDTMKAAHAIEQEIDDLTVSMAEKHIERLNQGICTAEVGAEYLALASDMERIADHIYNVAKSIKELDKPPL
jgi:phosphate:Na+ symporter